MIGKDYPYTYEEDLAYFILSKVWIESELVEFLKNTYDMWDWSTFTEGTCPAESCTYDITKDNLHKLHSGIGTCPVCNQFVFCATQKLRKSGPLYDHYSKIDRLVRPTLQGETKKYVRARSTKSKKVEDEMAESILTELFSDPQISLDDPAPDASGDDGHAVKVVPVLFKEGEEDE